MIDCYLAPQRTLAGKYAEGFCDVNGVGSSAELLSELLYGITRSGCLRAKCLQNYGPRTSLTKMTKLREATR